MTKAEQETIIRWDPDSETVSIFTAHPPTARKLQRAGYRHYKLSTLQGDPCGWFYRLPLTELHWRVGAKRRPRPLSDAEKETRRSILRQNLRRTDRHGDHPIGNQGGDSPPPAA